MLSSARSRPIFARSRTFPPPRATSFATPCSTSMLSSAQIERFYQDHGREVLGYLARRCPADAAHDLLQETFLQVARHAERLEAVTMPRAWLFGIARHV